MCFFCVLVSISQSIALFSWLKSRANTMGNQQKCQASIKCLCVYSIHVTNGLFGSIMKLFYFAQRAKNQSKRNFMLVLYNLQDFDNGKFQWR